MNSSDATVPHAPRGSVAIEAVPAPKEGTDQGFTQGPNSDRSPSTGPKARRTGGTQSVSFPDDKGATLNLADSTRERLPIGLNWSEATIQRQIFNILNLRGVKGLVYWHPANEEPNARRRLWKAQQGVKAGIPDIQLYYRNKLYCLELKKLGGKATEAQFEMLDRFREQGAEVTIAFGYFDAIAWLERMKLLIGRTV